MESKISSFVVGLFLSIILLGLFLSRPSYAVAGQWSSSGSTIYYNDGNLGIGTSTPTGLLDVGAKTAGVTAGQLVVDEASDRVYVGRLSSTGGDNTRRFIVRNRVGADLVNVDIDNGTTYLNTHLFVNGGSMNFASGGTYYFRVNSTALWAREIRVNNSWADYVFDEDYQLMPLSEVKEFINENGHLPNIPSAKEVEKEDLNVGEMLRLQMEKIEELTLYVIDLEKRVKELEVAN